jgi:hypothetical protein
LIKALGIVSHKPYFLLTSRSFFDMKYTDEKKVARNKLL